MITCAIHGDFDPDAYYLPREIEEMMEEQGFVDCPFCLEDIVDQGCA